MCDYQALSDEELMLRHQHGDCEAGRVLVVRLKPVLAAEAGRLFDAKDARERVWRVLDFVFSARRAQGNAWAPDLGAVSAWLISLLALLAADDEKLIESFYHGVGLPFEELYRRYEPYLYNFAKLRLGCPQEAYDCTAETFQHVLKSRTFDPARKRFKAWIFGIHRHVIAEVHRKKSRGKESIISQMSDGKGDEDGVFFADGLFACASSPDDLAMNNADIESVRGALVEMRADWRYAIYCRYFLDMDAQDTASMLGCTVRAVYMRSHYGKRWLLNRLNRVKDVQEDRVDKKVEEAGKVVNQEAGNSNEGARRGSTKKHDGEREDSRASQSRSS